jgi:hypothetical protein
MAWAESFPTEVSRRLKTYVYRLINPRNGETFYVGKGQGNRVFAHIREEYLEGDELDTTNPGNATSAAMSQPRCSAGSSSSRAGPCLT